MKLSFIGLFLLIMSAQSSYAQQTETNTSATSSTPEQQELLDLSKAKWLWMSDKKVDTLNALFDEKAMFVHMGGTWGKPASWKLSRVA